VSSTRDELSSGKTRSLVLCFAFDKVSSLCSALSRSSGAGWRWTHTIIITTTIDLFHGLGALIPLLVNTHIVRPKSKQILQGDQTR